MNKRFCLITWIGVVSFMLGADTAQKKSKMDRLGQMKMRDVAPGDGFEYFSGYLDTGEMPSNYLTIYSFKNIGDVPKVTIIGHNINLDFPVSQIDRALKVYELLVQQKVTDDQRERDRLSKEIERHLREK